MTSKDLIIINGHYHKLFHFEKISHAEALSKSEKFYQWINKRRSIREFSTDPVPKSIIENIIKSASTAPSGAHHQPWTFCAISNPKLKEEIRNAAENEEKEAYKHRMNERWKKDLEYLATNMNKPFLTEAPWLIAVFKKPYDVNKNGDKVNNYYVNESVGIACGLLITAIHNAGLVTLTYTPSPMNFLSKVLNRPSHERPYLLLPVGYPKEPVHVPNLKRKELSEIAVFYE